MTELLSLPFKPVSGKPPTPVLHRFLDAVASAGDKTLVLTLSEQKRKRSQNQNAYYWGVVVPPILAMLREMGNNVDAEDVHDYLKQEVGKLNQVVVLPDGEVKRMVGSSKKLTKLEFEVYLTKVRAWAAEFGVMIPLPNEAI